MDAVSDGGLEFESGRTAGAAATGLTEVDAEGRTARLRLTGLSLTGSWRGEEGGVGNGGGTGAIVTFSVLYIGSVAAGGRERDMKDNRK